MIKIENKIKKALLLLPIPLLFGFKGYDMNEHKSHNQFKEYKEYRLEDSGEDKYGLFLNSLEEHKPSSLFKENYTFNWDNIGQKKEHPEHPIHPTFPDFNPPYHPKPPIISDFNPPHHPRPPIVPEPVSSALFLAGGGVLFWKKYRERRRRNKH